MPISILPASPSDSALYITYLGHYEGEAISIGPDPTSAETRAAVAKRHQHAWNMHAEQGYPTPVGLKAVRTDAETGAEEVVGYANWYLFDRPRETIEEQQSRAPNWLMDGGWVADVQKRERMLELQRPVLGARERHMGGQPHGLLVYLCVDAKARGTGIGSRLVQWGLDRCQELSVPAYLEASEMGFPVYKKLGFEVLEKLLIEDDPPLAIMMWKPQNK